MKQFVTAVRFQFADGRPVEVLVDEDLVTDVTALLFECKDGRTMRAEREGIARTEDVLILDDLLRPFLPPETK